MSAPERYSAEWLVQNCDIEVPFERAVKREMERLLRQRAELTDALLQVRMWLQIETEFCCLDAEGTQVEFSEFLGDPQRPPETITIASSLAKADAAIANVKGEA